MFLWLSGHNIPTTFPTNRLRKLREQTRKPTHTTHHATHAAWRPYKLFVFCGNKTWANISEYTKCTVQKA